MKSAEPKKSTATNHSKDNSPFFEKGVHSFFSGEAIQKKPAFFSAQKSSETSPIQAKLTVGQPGDRFEKEADNMADKVVQRLSEPSPAGNPSPASTPSPGSNLSPANAKPSFTPFVQTKCASCEKEEKLQKKDEAEPGEEQQIQRK